MSGSPDPDRRGRPCRAATAAALALLLLATILASRARGEHFTIRSFRTAIEVRADASLRIAETIEAEFVRPRHGIFRDIPFRYTDELGKRTLTPIRVVAVTDGSGNARKYRTERTGGFVRVRIGDPDRFVGGRQVYVVTYNVENGVLFFPDHDELYWNATGNDWPVPIDAAQAAVTVPAGERALSLRTGCFTGVRGSRESACRASEAHNGATFVSTRPFGAGEGLTVVLGWDKGVVRAPKVWQTALYKVDLPRNWVFILPLLTLGYMAALWYRKGKDPVTGDPLVVAYTPPEEDGRPLLPAEIGALIDEKLDPRDVTASVVDLAVRKYLTIEETKAPGLLFHKTDYVLHRLKEPDADLPPFERLLLERIFSGHDRDVGISDLKLSFYKNLPELESAAFAALKAMKFFTAAPSAVKARYVRAGVLILVAAAGVGAIGAKLLPDPVPMAPAAVVLSGAVVLLFAFVMPVKTLKGVKALERVKGFEEFLMRAEKDRLERMADSNLLERYLPYAIALDVSDRWAKAFEGIYQEPPGWYVSGGGSGTFRPSSFHHSLDSALSSMSGAMYSSPRSGGSGFSGGGSSGGGGGGGGGGSW
jgi:uncharacterized membrane protein YgcG